MSNAITADYLDKKLDELAVKMFQYIDKKSAETNEKIDKLEASVEKLTSTIDSFVKRLDDIETDNVARDAQLARLERWIEQIATKTGVKLEY